MEKFLLMREPLSIVRISTALFVRVEQGEWSGVLEKELRSFGTGKKLAKW
ncbi:15000_t:CDS:2, partial [Funneliformis geosporum]